jgi:hypothetical protein
MRMGACGVGWESGMFAVGGTGGGSGGEEIVCIGGGGEVYAVDGWTG